MTDNIGGKIWSEVRQGLARHRERLVAAFDAGSYEAESTILDDIARKITEQVEPMISDLEARLRIETKRADDAEARETFLITELDKLIEKARQS